MAHSFLAVRASRGVVRLLCAATLTLSIAFTGTAGAQGDPEWVSLDGSPAGTPPRLTFDSRGSDGQMSTFDLVVPGFFYESYDGPDGRIYKRLFVPPNPILLSDRALAPGLPGLPVLTVDVAVATGAEAAMLMTEFTDVASLTGFGNVSPVWTPELDHPGTPARFIRDDSVYGSDGPWPPTDGTPNGPVQAMVGGIPGASVQLYPFHWDPATGELRVYRRARFRILHEGTEEASPPLTRETIKRASQTFHNWQTVAPFFPENVFTFTGDYLIVTTPTTRPALLPLIHQKWARGFRVQIATIPETGNTCSSIRAIINAWYNSTPAWRDHYCLLVGDVDRIPLCSGPNGTPTDDLYGSTNGDDLHEEVYVGRLSVNGFDDCTTQVVKILAYEDLPQPFGNYAEALLVAHREGAPGKYVGAHESVRTASYTTPPNFTTQYGHLGSAFNTAVRNEIDAGLGLVAYRGHGSSTEWWSWNLLSQSFDNAQVNALANDPMAPVVWSFACDNQALGTSDCIGENWMARTAGRGAVSHYGSTIPSGTLANHELDRRMFKAVYDLGLTTQSQAIEYAEHQMGLLEGTANAWMYLLLGDPDMQIRRRAPKQFLLELPVVVSVCPSPPCNIEILVQDEVGNPVPGALVGVYKPAAERGMATSSDATALTVLDAEPEVFENRYTDADGIAVIPAAPTTPGEILFTVQDDEGNSMQGSIPVVQPTGVAPAGAGTGIALSARPTVTHGRTHLGFGRSLADPGRVTLFDVTGRRVRTIEVPSQVAGVDWDGHDDSGRSLGSGLYLAVLESGVQRASTRVMIVR